MSDITVNQAAEWARVLTQREVRGNGDLENAWRRLETRYGIPAQTFWSLRYRRPKDVLASVYLRLQSAYRAECERQMRRLQHEIQITEQLAGPDHRAVVAAKAVVGEGADQGGTQPVRPEELADDPMEFPAFLKRSK